MKKQKLSIIIPVYNEEKNIAEIVKRVKKVNLPVKKEIIIIDDFSKDGTRDALKRMSGKDINVLFHSKNMGKGRAIRTGLKEVNGDFVVIQDADLEYDPQDYKKLIAPLMDGRAKVVYGSRNLGKGKHDKSYLSFYLGGVFLSKLANILYGLNITDEATCYKVFKTNIIKNVNLKCERFEFCPEVTAKVAKMGVDIIEVPISYNPRSKNEGKKINWKDGMQAIWTLVKYRFVD